MYDLVVAVEPLAPNFVGVKYTGLYTHPGFMDAMRVMAYRGGKFEVLGGREEMMLEALSVGIRGHVGSQFNYAGDLYNELRTGYEREGLTTTSQARLRGLQLTSIKLVHAWLDAAPTGVNGAKAFANYAGLPVGSARLPSLPLNDAAASALKAAFATFCAGTRGDVERATVEAAGGGVVLRAASAVLQMCNGKAASR